MRQRKHSAYSREAEILCEEQRDSQERFDTAWEGGGSRMTVQARCLELGISEEEAWWFLQTFGPIGSSYLQMKFAEGLGSRGICDPRGWTMVNRPDNGAAIPLKDIRIVLDHLLHRRRILSTRRCRRVDIPSHRAGESGIHGRIRVTDQLVLDLDVHSIEAAATIRDRYARIVNLACASPMVFRSSMSGGLQLIWWLSRWWVLRDLHEYARQRLSSAGVRVKTGEVEIFPNERGHIRMPLGAHGAMLDPRKLEPIEEPLVNIFRRNKVGRKEHVAHEYVLGKPGSGPPSIGDHPTPQDCGTLPSETAPMRAVQGDHAEDARVYEQGLSEENSRFHSLPRLVRHAYFQRGYQDEKPLVSHLLEWLEQNHNGCSNRYLTNPEQVEADIRRVVSKHFKYVRETGATGQPRYDEKEELFLPDYQEILKVAARLQPHLGDEVKPKAVRHGLCELLRYIKRKAGTDTISPTVPLSTGVMKKWFRFWSMNPNVPTYYRNWLDALEQVGLLVLADRRTATGRCRRYKLNHSFVNEGHPLTEFEMGLMLAEGSTDVQEAPRYTKPPLVRAPKQLA